jgi:hypothetical protein
MKIPAVRVAARETLLTAAAEGYTLDVVKKRMWQRNAPPIVWRDEMTDLQITVDAKGNLHLPENVIVISPGKEILPRANWMPENAA